MNQKQVRRHLAGHHFLPSRSFIATVSSVAPVSVRFSRPLSPSSDFCLFALETSNRQSHLTGSQLQREREAWAQERTKLASNSQGEMLWGVSLGERSYRVWHC